MKAKPPFETVVRDHGPTVFRVCCAVVGAHDADDAWSETFLAALRGYPDLRPGSNLAGWLATIAHHKGIDQLRARSRRPEAAGDLADRPAGAVAGPEPADGELLGVLAGLPDKQRLAGVYRYLVDLAYTEVAALLECSEAAARRNASDGIARLRRHYRKDES